MNFISRLKEPSTWRGLIMLTAVFGLNIDPDIGTGLASGAGAIYALINIFRKE